MKKITLLVTVMAFFLFGKASRVVPVEDAVKVSRNFLSERLGSLEARDKAIRLVHTEYSEAGDPLYYRFQIDDKGFIIVSATELSTPVLAYSLESNFNGKAGGDYMCKNYKAALQQLVAGPKAGMQADKGWAHYLSDNFSPRRLAKGKTAGFPSVEPLVTTLWTQETFFNTYCPVHPESPTNWDMRVPVGCVALTMGNIMFYYRYPESGTGGVTYFPKIYDDETGELAYTFPLESEYFSTSHYDYDAIPDNLDGYSRALSNLLHQSGVSVRMGYGPTGSGAPSESALEALQTFFKYSKTAKFQNYTDIVPDDNPELNFAHLWPDKIKSELEEHRPLFFSASYAENQPGHAYIVDGYITEQHIDADTTWSYTYDTTQTITYDTVTEVAYDTVTETLFDTTYTTVYDTTWDEAHETVDHIDSSTVIHIDTTDGIHVSSDTTTRIDTIYGLDITAIDSAAEHTQSDTSYNDYFHVNWGWAGEDNGFYLVKKMNSPQFGFFNLDESIMVNLKPDDESAYAKPDTSERHITASTGTISDGAGNMKYAPNSYRRWVFACPFATSYTFRFSKLKIKSGDKVTIYNGASEDDGIMREYSGDYLMAAANDYAGHGACFAADFPGQPLPEALTVSKDSVLVVFTSNDDDETDYGFVLEYRVKDYSIETCKSTTHILSSEVHSGVITDKPGNAVGSTDPYRASSVCQYKFHTPATGGYTFNFTKFDLKDGDFVDFYIDGSTPQFFARYDINNLPSGVFTINAAKVLVKFVADNWNEGNGFELHYDVITGIDDHGSLENVGIYPNPATDLLNVTVESDDVQNITATVCDMAGKVIRTEDLAHPGGARTYRIPVGDMAKGLYFLNLQSEKGRALHKFIVQ